MTNEELIREFSELPQEAQRKAEAFIAWLRISYSKKKVKRLDENLSEEDFVGMWKDREDLPDGAAWVREMRQSEWAK